MADVTVTGFLPSRNYAPFLMDFKKYFFEYTYSSVLEEYTSSADMLTSSLNTP